MKETFDENIQTFDPRPQAGNPGNLFTCAQGKNSKMNFSSPLTFYEMLQHFQVGYYELFKIT